MSRWDESYVPSYRRHRGTGQAVVTIGGKDIYLGRFNSPDSRREYERLIREWMGRGRTVEPDDADGLTVVELVASFRRWAKDFYRDGDGNVARTVENFDEALKPLVKLYGTTPAAEFGPLKLKAVRQAYIDADRVRSNINRHTTRLKFVFAWGVENELIPPSVHHGLCAVKGLRAGRGGAREGSAVKPVPVEHVRAVEPHVARQVWAMIQLQLLTGMRPGEVTIMRGCDLDTTGELWTYTPSKHKTQVHGKSRTVYLGPKAQDVLRPLLRMNLQEYLFSPADAERERRERLHATRKTPMSCGNVPGSNRTRKPSRTIGEFYKVSAYYTAVIRGCDAAFPPPVEMTDADDIRQWRKEHRWHVHQLRHRAATDLRKQYGVEVASVMLGHAKVETAQIYAEKSSQLAQRVAAEVG